MVTVAVPGLRCTLCSRSSLEERIVIIARKRSEDNITFMGELCPQIPPAPKWLSEGYWRCDCGSSELCWLQFERGVLVRRATDNDAAEWGPPEPRDSRKLRGRESGDSLLVELRKLWHPSKSYDQRMSLQELQEVVENIGPYGRALVGPWRRMHPLGWPE